VSSFVIDNPEFDEVSKTSEKFLARKTSLPEDSDHLDRTVDPETQARLEALLEAAGSYHYFFKAIKFQFNVIQVIFYSKIIEFCGFSK